jgi:serine/tyrosine/threonine adenylyltransferase
MSWNFNNSYFQLPKELFKEVVPTSVEKPKIAIFNSNLAVKLGLSDLNPKEEVVAQYLAGNKILEGSQPIAQAYAGHQFGHFTMLGDGRAILLGEQITPNDERFDIQLKGAGITPFSRRGDGRATLKAMLREYLISEAMFHLGIPTSRSLAVVTTGEAVYREDINMGAVLTRIASSHIRVGTFEYASRFCDKNVLQTLTEYSIKRHYPDLIDAFNPALALLSEVMQKQISLIVEWLRVGFIHGVMNTDNMSISGETFDYGPCAFMNRYHPQTVFSSIDSDGRYAFMNQPNIGFWNLARFAEALLPIIDENPEKAIEKAKAILEDYPHLYERAYQQMMLRKIGISTVKDGDKLLITGLLEWMLKNEADYSNTFIQLSQPNFSDDEIYENEDFITWKNDWEKRLLQEDYPQEKAFELMQQTNPAFIPRNHKVEEALNDVHVEGNFTTFMSMLKVVSTPYDYNNQDKAYQTAPKMAAERLYQTFCGT